MPVFIAKHNERPPGEIYDNPDLLNTIKVPKNLSLLTERLPKSNYESDKKVAAAQKLKQI